jgi:hypothetical protein
MTLAENVLFDAALRVPQRIAYAEKMHRIGHVRRRNASMATRVENSSRKCDMGDTKTARSGTYSNLACCARITKTHPISLISLTTPPQ